MSRVIGVVLGAFALAACASAAETPALSPTPLGSLSQSAADVPSAAATSGTSASPSPGAQHSLEPTLSLGPDVIAEVVTGDLVMRSAPAVSPESMIYPGRLGPGDRLYLVTGPVHTDGFDWYLAAPFKAQVNQQGNASSTEWVRFGWLAAADKTGEPWIAPIEPVCPTNVTVETLHDLQAELRLACFGDVSVSLEGEVSCHDLGPPIPAPAPDWLTWDACYINPSGAPRHDPITAESRLGIPIHYPPDAQRVAGSLAVIGHFDDPQATRCLMFIPTLESDVFGQRLQHQATQLGCRASLVVDSTAPAGDAP
jgi:hypothetical protein